MNYFRVQSALLAGIQAVPVSIECAQTRRLPYLQILGGSGPAVGELRERVIAALGTLQDGKFRLPARRFTVQIQPGARGLPLEQVELAVAVALLGSTGFVPAERVAGLLVCGGLGLDGRLTGAVPVATIHRLLGETGCESALLPWEGAPALERGQLARGGGFRSLTELAAFLRGGPAPVAHVRGAEAETELPPPDQVWSRVSGQAVGLRAIEIAAAGSHHLVLAGPEGARADLLARALSLLLPPLGATEAEEVRGVYALAGVAGPAPVRPFHVFGSRPSLPSLLRDRRFRVVEEALLAHRGVLLVDRAIEREAELFPALREPMLRGRFPARLHDRTAEVAADAVVVASTPLCGCGAQGDPRLACGCRPAEARRFAAQRRRLLGAPFDLWLTIGAERAAEAPADWRASAARVSWARARIRARAGTVHARLGEEDLFTKFVWEPNAVRLWGVLEGRAGCRRAIALARVAATLSDLREGQSIKESDLLEALHYFPPAAESVGPGKAVSASTPAVNSIAIP